MTGNLRAILLAAFIVLECAGTFAVFDAWHHAEHNVETMQQ